MNGFRKLLALLSHCVCFFHLQLFTSTILPKVQLSAIRRIIYTESGCNVPIIIILHCIDIVLHNYFAIPNDFTINGRRFATTLDRLTSLRHSFRELARNIALDEWPQVVVDVKAKGRYVAYTRLFICTYVKTARMMQARAVHVWPYASTCRVGQGRS